MCIRVNPAHCVWYSNVDDYSRLYFVDTIKQCN